MDVERANSGAKLTAANRRASPATGNALDRLLSGGRMLCDGAMGTMLTDRGISMDGCYDALNISEPATVAKIHTEYLQAGAEIIETNTFGGNAFRLKPYGLCDKVREINLAGVQIARACVTQMPGKQKAEALIAGSIGPLGIRLTADDKVELTEARVAFAEQIRALAEGGPGVGADLLMIETMTSLAEACEAIRAAQEVAAGMRLIVMMTVDKNGNCLDGASAEAAAVRLTELGADAIGCNCSSGPASVLRAVIRMRAATHLPLMAMPNAGLPSVLEGRTIHPVSPTEMSDFVGRFIKEGVSLVGGCCGTTPDHTRAMKSALQIIRALEKTASEKQASQA